MGRWKGRPEPAVEIGAAGEIGVYQSRDTPAASKSRSFETSVKSSSSACAISSLSNGSRWGDGNFPAASA
jgi:hypothetical protein